MEFQYFVQLVANMRALQREFFRLKPADRPPYLIDRAKHAEKAVDEFINEYRNAAWLFKEKDA